MDLNKIPRLIADQISINYSQKLINLGFRSGESMTAYALSPEAAKMLQTMLGEKLKAFEQQYGPIDVTHMEAGIESPIQVTS